MTPETLTRDIYKTTSFALKAIPYIPKGSYYRTWIYQLIDEKIPATKYTRLKARLQRFYGEEWA